MHCFGLFYQFNQEAQKTAVLETIKCLNEIKCWFKKQKTYNFFASSILITYESNLRKRMCEENVKSSQLVRAKVCDLTHVFRCDKIDENFLFGLNCLIDHLKKLLSEEYVYQNPTIRSLSD